VTYDRVVGSRQGEGGNAPGRHFSGAALLVKRKNSKWFLRNLVVVVVVGVRHFSTRRGAALLLVGTLPGSLLEHQCRDCVLSLYLFS